MVARIAAFLILWMVFAAVLAPFIGQFIHAGAREMPPAPVDPAPPGQGPGAGPGEEEAQL